MMSFEQKLRERCLEQDIPVDDWGQPGTTTLPFSAWLEEIEDGSARVSLEGKVECWRQSVCLDAYHRPATGMALLLWDTVQEYLWPGFQPVPKVRNRPYLSESWRQGKGETYFHTAQRCFWEETGIPEDLVREHLPLEAFNLNHLEPLPAYSKPYLSTKFLKLPTIRTRIFVTAHIPGILFRPDGHQVTEKNVRSNSKYYPVSVKEKPLAYL